MSDQSKAKEAKEEILEKRKNEIIGILIITLGLFSGLSIFTQTTGMLGKILSDFYFKIAGWGTYLFPLLLLIWGFALVRLKKLKFNLRLLGFFLTFFMSLALIHIYYFPDTPLQLGLESQGGGIIGGSMAWVLSSL